MRLFSAFLTYLQLRLGRDSSDDRWDQRANGDHPAVPVHVTYGVDIPDIEHSGFIQDCRSVPTPPGHSTFHKSGYRIERPQDHG